MMNKTDLKCLFLEVYWQLTPQYITVSVMSCVISSIFALTSVLGNGTIMFVIWKTKELHSPSFTLLFCLAVADILVGLISQPALVAFKTAELLRQYNVYCSLRLIQFFFGWITGSVSYLILSAITIDRLLALSLHLRYKSIVTVPRITTLVIVIWLLISILTASKIWMGDKWVVFPIVINVFAVLTTALCTYKIFYIARKHLNEIKRETQSVMHIHSRTADVVKCKNSAVTVIYLYVVMLLFYLPLLAVMIVENIIGVTPSVQLSYDLVTTFVFLNSSVNPIIYCWRMKHVRSAVKKRFRC